MLEKSFFPFIVIDITGIFAEYNSLRSLNCYRSDIPLLLHSLISYIVYRYSHRRLPIRELSHKEIIFHYFHLYQTCIRHSFDCFIFNILTLNEYHLYRILVLTFLRLILLKPLHYKNSKTSLYVYFSLR